MNKIVKGKKLEIKKQTISLLTASGRDTKPPTVATGNTGTASTVFGCIYGND
jgi:hypothetical protein